MDRAWPYVAPYAVLLGCAELARWLPPSFEAPLLALRVLGPAALLTLAWRRGAFRELAAGPSAAGFLLDVGFGVAIAALWLAPYLLVPSLPRGTPFDPEALGPGWRPAWIALRLAGFIAVSPLVEELFVRSFLHRAVEAWPDWRAFGAHRLAEPQRAAFFATVAWFALSHAAWEWWVALPTGVLLNLWFYLRGQLRSVWIVHATANAALGATVGFGPWQLWEFL